MTVRRRNVLKLAAASAAQATLSTQPASAKSADVLERDVAIIGGGSAGVYAATRLRDMGRSVIVLERSGRLGGHAETFHDPVTGAPIDIGVIVFPDTPLVRGYFGRFGVPLVTASFGQARTQFVDFRTGLAVDAFNPAGADVGAALFAYLQLLTTRFGFLELNGFQLPGPGPVLDDLLLPFRQFVQKYSLNALVPTFFLFEQGFGSLLNATTLYLMKNMNAAIVGALLSGTFLATPVGTSALYEAAGAALGSDAVLDARVLRVERNDGHKIQVTIHTPEGIREVRARKLLVTAPPVLSSFAGFDLDIAELSTFARFDAQHYSTAVAKIGGNLQGVSLVNTAPETPFNVAPLPGIYSIGPSPAPGLYNIKYGSSEPLADARVRRAIQRDVERVRVPGIAPLDFESFGIFKNHTPYSLQASPHQIRKGFYRDLQGLQGRNNTFYAGAAFQTHSSASIWAFVEGLLPTLFA